MNPIKEFRGKYFFLSNFYNAKIEYFDMIFENNEAAFQSMKCPERMEEFTKLSAAEAKRLGRRVPLCDDWEESKETIMFEICLTEQLKNFWNGEVVFDTDGDPGDEYEFSEEDNNSNESDVYWHLSLKNDYYIHTFVDLIRTPLHTKQEETV